MHPLLTNCPLTRSQREEFARKAQSKAEAQSKQEREIKEKAAQNRAQQERARRDEAERRAQEEAEDSTRTPIGHGQLTTTPCLYPRYTRTHVPCSTLR